jgi:hypothetical protein
MLPRFTTLFYSGERLQRLWMDEDIFTAPRGLYNEGVVNMNEDAVLALKVAEGDRIAGVGLEGEFQGTVSPGRSASNTPRWLVALLLRW